MWRDLEWRRLLETGGGEKVKCQHEYVFAPFPSGGDGRRELVEMGEIVEE